MLFVITFLTFVILGCIVQMLLKLEFSDFACCVLTHLLYGQTLSFFEMVTQGSLLILSELTWITYQLVGQ